MVKYLLYDFQNIFYVRPLVMHTQVKGFRQSFYIFEEIEGGILLLGNPVISSILCSSLSQFVTQQVLTLTLGKRSNSKVKPVHLSFFVKTSCKAWYIFLCRFLAWSVTYFGTYSFLIETYTKSSYHGHIYVFCTV